MRYSLRTGFSFGLTSGVITTLGLIVGLHSGTHSRLAVLGGILTIAVADAFSDALGIHVSEESKKTFSGKEIWESTVATFLAKIFFASTFLVPVLLFSLSRAIFVSVLWGFLLLGFFSYFIGKEKGENPWRAVGEHLFIGLLVILITHFLGDFLGSAFV
jgi:VIT1/CCC1 family predicted Fe2+/Mn2+ transporter